MRRCETPRTTRGGLRSCATRSETEFERDIRVTMQLVLLRTRCDEMEFRDYRKYAFFEGQYVNAVVGVDFQQGLDLLNEKRLDTRELADKTMLKGEAFLLRGLPLVRRNKVKIEALQETVKNYEAALRDSLNISAQDRLFAQEKIAQHTARITALRQQDGAN